MSLRSLRTGRIALLATVAVLAGSQTPAAAAGAAHRAVPVRVVSGPSPFAAGCPGAALDDTHVAGDEIEPAITVNPANPRNIVATWQQDLGLAARSDLVGSSLDGGKTWKRSTIPGLTACTGGTADAASDPWLAAGPDGTIYFLGIALDLGGDLINPPSAIVASRSRDGGRSWTTPSTVAPSAPGNETSMISADPMHAGRAYAVWANWDHTYSFPLAATVSFARTSDGGRTWSAPGVIDRPGPTSVDQAPRLLVLPDGALLAVFARGDLAAGIGSLHAARSVDGGRTWQPAVLAGSQPIQMFFDPETGDEYPQPGFPSAAVAPDGTVYIATERDTSVTSGGIGVASSRDGGVTWTSTAVTGVTAFAFHPSIAVNAHGTVGVTWYDLRNDRAGDDALTADAWFARSHDRGKTWRQTHVAGPLNIRGLPSSGNGHQLGEYQGLAAIGAGGFAAIFTVPAPLAQDGPTDIAFARITQP